MKRISFILDDETAQRAKVRAAKESVTISEVLRLFIDAWLDDELNLLYKKAFDGTDTGQTGSAA